jgi:hypothetical protein
MRRSGQAVLAFATTMMMLCGTPAVVQASGRNETFYIDMPGDVLSVTHGGAVGLAVFPASIQPLPAELKSGFALTTLVRNEKGVPIGFASEMEDFPEGPSKPWLSWWTVVIPGRGTIFGYEIESVPDAHKEIFAKVAAGGDWTGKVTARIASGPRADGEGIIIGGTGDYAGATGTLSEWTTLTGLTRAGKMSGTMELRVHIDPAPGK